MGTIKSVNDNYTIIVNNGVKGNFQVTADNIILNGNVTTTGSNTTISPFITVAANNSGVIQDMGMIAQLGPNTYAGLRFDTPSLAWQISTSVTVNGDPIEPYANISSSGSSGGNGQAIIHGNTMVNIPTIDGNVIVNVAGVTTTTFATTGTYFGVPVNAGSANITSIVSSNVNATSVTSTNVVSNIGTFTGNLFAPTQAYGSNTNAVATTQFVQAALGGSGSFSNAQIQAFLIGNSQISISNLIIPNSGYITSTGNITTTGGVNGGNLFVTGRSNLLGNVTIGNSLYRSGITATGNLSFDSFTAQGSNASLHNSDNYINGTLGIYGNLVVAEDRISSLIVGGNAAVYKDLNVGFDPLSPGVHSNITVSGNINVNDSTYVTANSYVNGQLTVQGANIGANVSALVVDGPAAISTVTIYGNGTAANPSLYVNGPILSQYQLYSSDIFNLGTANTANIGNSTSPFQNIYAQTINANTILNTGTANTGAIGTGAVPFGDIYANTIHSSSILNVGAAGTGNIGSNAVPFQYVFATATAAQYADLAEMYVSDADYPYGTVMQIGGTHEVTITDATHTTKIIGIVSENPSYLMNSTQEGEFVIPMALMGRVKCNVVGNITKGDRLVASDVPGVATVLDDNKYQPGCTIAKALENYNSEEVGQILVAVGIY